MLDHGIEKDSQVVFHFLFSIVASNKQPRD